MPQEDKNYQLRQELVMMEMRAAILERSLHIMTQEVHNYVAKPKVIDTDYRIMCLLHSE